MKRKRITDNNQRSILFGGSMGIIAAMILSLVFAAVLAMMVINERLGEDAMNYFSFFILLISTFLGALVAYKIVMRRCALVVAVVSLAYLLILAAITILCFDGAFNGLWTGVLAIALGSAASCAVCISTAGKRTKRKYRSR